MCVRVLMIVSTILQSSRWQMFRVGIPHTTWRICCPQCAHNFVMQMGTPHMRNFRPPSPYAYWESPYAYGDQILMSQRSFCQSRIEAEFCACTLAHSHQKPLLYYIISIALHSLFAFGDILHSLSICDIVRFYHFTLWTLNRQPYQIWKVCQLFRHSRKLPKSIPLNRKVLSWILG